MKDCWGGAELNDLVVVKWWLVMLVMMVMMVMVGNVGGDGGGGGGKRGRKDITYKLKLNIDCILSGEYECT